MKRKQVDVILLEVDMSRTGKPSCDACDVAKQQLTKALDVVTPLLRDVNVDLRFNNVVVSTEEQARQLRFRGSPTLRVGDFEVVPTHVSDSEERAWQWGSQEHAVPPVGLFVDAILRGWAGAESETPDESYAVPGYLASYLTAKADPAPGSCSTCG
jgi:Domain of unknown function (DUF2703)